MVTMRYSYWVTFVLLFSQSEALLGYHSNQSKSRRVFSKLGVIHYVLVYNMPWSTFRKVLKFNVWIFELRSYTPLKLIHARSGDFQKNWPHYFHIWSQCSSGKIIWKKKMGRNVCSDIGCHENGGHLGL